MVDGLQVGERKVGLASALPSPSEFGILTEACASPLCPTATNPPCPKCGRKSIKDGKQRNGTQRYACSKCHFKFQIEYKDIRGEGNPNWKGNKVHEDTARGRVSESWSSTFIPVPKGYERHHIEFFSSDDFRRYQLDRFIRDKQHGIGGFFAKMKHNGLIVECGYTRSTLASNHSHTIRLYKWSDTYESER